MNNVCLASKRNSIAHPTNNFLRIKLRNTNLKNNKCRMWMKDGYLTSKKALHIQLKFFCPRKSGTEINKFLDKWTIYNGTTWNLRCVLQATQSYYTVRTDRVTGNLKESDFNKPFAYNEWVPKIIWINVVCELKVWLSSTKKNLRTLNEHFSPLISTKNITKVAYEWKMFEWRKSFLHSTNIFFPVKLYNKIYLKKSFMNEKWLISEAKKKRSFSHSTNIFLSTQRHKKS